MTCYSRTLEYLYSSTPVFERKGAEAYKPGLANSMALDEHLGRPHHSYYTVHVGGTNGKGSVSHTVASVLNEAGYSVGLYTSPHLVDFCERIRVNGNKVSQDFIVDFVEKHRSFFEPLSPSFFEIVTAMAFEYFKTMKVDIAVIEAGLGGRLDCTNIITPILGVITGISKDHTDLLGNTLSEIAGEKAGIIKEGIPVVIGKTMDDSVKKVFIDKAIEKNAPLIFAQSDLVNSMTPKEQGWIIESKDFGALESCIAGSPQKDNNLTILAALRVLKSLLPDRINSKSVAEGFSNVIRKTGLRGRWEKLSDRPCVIADIAHNPDAWQWICHTLKDIVLEGDGKLRIITGFSSDKDVDEILPMLPAEANYVFTNADSERALPAAVLETKASMAGLKGISYQSVADAVHNTLQQSGENDFILISGSNFVVAEAISYFDNLNSNNTK